MRSCPLRLLLALAIIFLTTHSDYADRVIGGSISKNELNIGTVLFEKSDSSRRCWTTEEFVLLNSRRMFQDLLPKVKVIHYENDHYIAHLMDYFHICLESVRKLSVGKTKHLMLKALADTMGGYLQVYILPLTRHSYYAGNIKYRNARKLFELYEELKTLLRTNGAGWMNPCKDIKRKKIPSIVITPPKTALACDGIITYPTSSLEGTKEEFKRFPLKNKRLSSWPARGYDLEYDDYQIDDESMTIPLPFLDDEGQPNSIALPFRRDSLQSLYCEKSAFLLVKYYIASVKCIVSRANTEKDLGIFNKRFYDWLQQSVRRHLDDDKWYPAFGGVLRIIATLERSDATDIKMRKSGAHQTMPKSDVDHALDSIEDEPPFDKDSNDIVFGTTELISIAVVSALLVWLLVGLSLVCYRFLTRHSDECGPCELQTPPVSVVYENTEFCDPEMCPSKNLKKGLLEKLNSWWRYKFGKCPGGCEDRYADEERCLAAISYTSKDTVDVSSSSKVYQRRRYDKSVSTSPSGFQGDRQSSRV